MSNVPIGSNSLPKTSVEYISKYLDGPGIDISKNSFSDINCEKFYVEPDNFFTLKNKGIESLNYIICDDIIQKTKYYPIIIKEAFYALKVNGYFIINYIPKDISLENLEKELFFWMKNSIEIVAVFIDDGRCTIVSKKIKSNPSKPEGINNWSFGIVTRGTTDPIVDEIIENIRAQKIPNFEVIVCGKYNGLNRDKPGVSYIEFTERDDKGWTTKKKNLICEKAKYENIVVMHDRIKFHDDWFIGMKKYGNNWEILSTPTLHNDKRTFDWLTLKYPVEDERSNWYLGSHLDYSDWDKWIYIDGGVIIFKKYVWEKVPWDETRYYGGAEDSKLSHDHTRYGFLIRLNPYSTMESFRFNHPFSKVSIKKHPKNYGRLKGPPHIVVAKYIRGYSSGIYSKFKSKK